MCDVGLLRWSASDLGAGENGDMMHFDLPDGVIITHWRRSTTVVRRLRSGAWHWSQVGTVPRRTEIRDLFSTIR